MQKIRCVVERITYQNPENGYSVLKCRVKDYSDLIPVIGNFIDANVGSVLIIEGNWKVDAKYGRQFVAENWEETLPATVYEIEKYLGSGLIKGVGPKFAKKIVQRFGVDTFVVIEDNMIQTPKVLNHCFDTTNCSVTFSNSRNNGALPRMARQNMPER